jgi:hypothetical protein
MLIAATMLTDCDHTCGLRLLIRWMDQLMEAAFGGDGHPAGQLPSSWP